MSMKELSADEMELVAGGWFLASQPPGGGGGGSNGLTIRIGQSGLGALDWASVAQGLHSTTVALGIRDIGYFRAVGGHIPSSQGSLINWGAAQVNWNQFGAGDASLSDEQVWANFVQATGNGP